MPVNFHQQNLITLTQYIDSNLTQPLTLSQLTKISGFSAYHLHRILSAHLGLPLNQYIQVKRLEKAAYQLSYRKHMTITDIAFDAGFSYVESFSRAFKSYFGHSPRQYRQTNTKQPEITLPPRRIAMPIEQEKFTVSIINLPDIQVATLRHIGDPNNVMTTVGKFIEWRRQYHTPPSVSDTYNLLYADPDDVEPQDYQFDICAQTDQPIENQDYGVFTQKIVGGRYAMLKFTGPDSQLSYPLSYLYGTWLEQQGHELRDAPCVIKRIKMFPDVPHHLTEIEILLPIN